MKVIVKICSQCKVEKTLEEFYHDRAMCKSCIAQWGKQYYKNNKKTIKQKKKLYVQNHKEQIKKRHHAWRVQNKLYLQQYNITNVNHIKNRKKQWYQDNKENVKQHAHQYYKDNKDIIKQRSKVYNQVNKEKRRIYYANRIKVDIQYKLRTHLRRRLNAAIKNNQKAGSAVKDLGCTVDFLKQYIESLWQLGMTWNNYGNKEGQWSIDHVIPLFKFDLTDREQFLKVNNYTNLQPMWHIDNLKKGKQ